MKSLQTQVTAARLVFKHAVRYEYIEKNPFDLVYYPKIQEEEEETEQREYWTKEEIIQFLAIAEQQSELRDFVAFRLLLFSGMRRGELCALTDEDINFEQRTIKVNKTFAWKKAHIVKIEPPKTKNSIREISIDQTTLALIKKLITANKNQDLQVGARSSRSRLIFYRYKDSEKAPLTPVHFNKN